MRQSSGVIRNGGNSKFAPGHIWFHAASGQSYKGLLDLLTSLIVVLRHKTFFRARGKPGRSNDVREMALE